MIWLTSLLSPVFFLTRPKSAMAGVRRFFFVSFDWSKLLLIKFLVVVRFCQFLGPRFFLLMIFSLPEVLHFSVLLMIFF